MFTAVEAGCDERVLGYRHGMKGSGRERSECLCINISMYKRE